jgi:hypothetical protein
VRVREYMKYNCFLILFISFFTYASPQYTFHGDKPHLGGELTATEEFQIDLVREEFESIIIKFPKEEVLKSIHGYQTDKDFDFKIYSVFGHQLKKSSFDQRARAPFILDIPVPFEKSHLLKIPNENRGGDNYYLIEFYVHANAASKMHPVKLELKTNKQSYHLTLKLNVFDLNLPKALSLKTSFGFSPWSVTKKHYGKWHENELNLHQYYYDQAVKHRIDLHKIYPKYPDYNEKHPKDLLSFDAQEKYAFLKIWEDYHKGFSSEYGFKWQITDLPVPPKFKNTDPLSLKYWEELEKSVVLNNLLDETYVYYDDEPKFDQIPMIKANLSVIKKHAPKLHFLLTKHYQKSLDGLIDWWCPNFSEWAKPNFPTPDFYQSRIKKGEKIWTYVSCMAHGCDAYGDRQEPDFVIDRPSSYARILPWYAIKENFSGILYYDTVYGYEFEGQSPWKDSYAFSGFGEGNLFYPCNEQLCGTKEQLVFSSLRLKIIRDGLEDSEILTMAKSKGINLSPYFDKIKSIPQSNKIFYEIRSELLKKLVNEKK